MSINTRIKIIKKELCNNSTKNFAVKMDISSQAVSNYVREGYNIGREVIENILKAFPEVNANWLLTGKGEMILNDDAVIADESDKVVREKEKKIKELEASIKEKDAIIKSLSVALENNSKKTNEDTADTA